MYNRFFCKALKDFDQDWLSQIAASTEKIWWTAKNNADGSLTFVKNKPNAQFYMAKLNHFPNIVDKILEQYPDAMIKNSYVTKCFPGYHMVPHIDPNRSTAIIIPLGANKGKISFYFKKFKLFTYTYKSPTLTRVNILHSAENDSDQIRYSVTLEVPGSYWTNVIKYQ